MGNSIGTSACLRATQLLHSTATCAGKRAQLWATFNEPEVASLCGHIMGNHPPGKVMRFKEGGSKLCTMLRAHAAAYKAIKAMPGKLGILHLFMLLIPCFVLNVLHQPALPLLH